MKRKLSFLFIIVVFIPMTISLIVISDLISERMKSTLYKRGKDTLNVANNVFSKFIDDTSLKAKIISKTEDIKNAISSKNNIELIDKLNLIYKDLNLSYYSGIIEIYDNSGVLIASEPKIKEKLVDKNTVSAVLNGEFISFTKLVNNKIKIVNAIPLYTNKLSTPSAVISLSFFVSNKISDEIKKITNSEIVIFNKTNKPKCNIIASSFIINGERVKPNININSLNIIDKSLSNYILFNSKQNILNNSFFIGVALSKTEIFNTLNSLKTTLILISCFSIIIAFIFALILAKKLIKPINTLVENTKIVGDGDLEKEIIIRSNDEFEFLAKMFNSMRLKIKEMLSKLKITNLELDKKVSDLGIINKINQVIINKKGTNILKEILKIITDSVNAEQSYIILSDNNEKLNINAFYSKNKDLISNNNSDLIIKISKNVMKNKVYETNDTSDETINKNINNYICIPLMNDIKIFGAMTIINKYNEFSNEDKDFLQNIADQVAVAIHNTKLYELAITDGMTKLYIHRYFQARLEEEVIRAKRFNKKLSLIMFDIDHFKNFNDTYGHQLGDIVIKKVAEILKESVREEIDIPARYGGEEFTVIMPETDIQGAFIFAERLRKKIASTIIPHNNEKLNITISLGCSEFPNNADSREKLIKEADSALYVSKENGRNLTTKA